MARKTPISIIAAGFVNPVFFMAAGAKTELPTEKEGYPGVVKSFKGKKIGVTQRGSGAEFQVIDMLAEGHDLRARLKENSAYFRERMSAAGFTLAGADHAIIPVMLGDAKLAAEMASRMLAAGIYVVGFSFPVVPKGQARIRTQLSAAHSREQLERALAAFTQAGREVGVIQ